MSQRILGFSAIVSLVLVSMDANSIAAIPDVSYVRHEPHHEDENVAGSLLTFVYDVPYLAACGVFPPYHILNLKLSSGGSIGGMGPGTTWKPFSITEPEYTHLARLIRTTSPAEVPGNPRFNLMQFAFDPEFDTHQDPIEWATSVCRKHREAHFEKQSKIIGETPN